MRTAEAAPAGAMLACVSHAPLILIRARAPASEIEVQERCTRLRAQIEAFDPEQIVFFGNDHFAGFHYDNMPGYCVGAACESVADLGGFGGAFQVPQADALSLLQFLRDSDFDPAVSYGMKVDHAFSQPLERLTGGIDRYPVIPVFMSVFTPPFIRLARSRRFGQAVGRWAAQTGKRTLFMGTGGLSHHPAHYFPMLGAAQPDVHGYQMHGASGGTMTDAEWFERFDRMHRQGAITLATGGRTAKDIRLNPELDRSVLGHLANRDAAAMDDWDQVDLVERGGVGILEIHSWIAATSAFAAVDEHAAIDAYYTEAIEYGGGYGMLSSPAA